MPIYEYRCRQCSKVFELLVRASSESTEAGPHCPECGGSELSRLFSLFAARSDTPALARSGGGGGGGGGCGGGCSCH